MNHNCPKQRCMNGSVEGPELITVTAVSLSQETRKRWCCTKGVQNFTATTTVKNSITEMWDAAERTMSGKEKVRHCVLQVALPRNIQASVVKRKFVKSQSAGFITETPLKQERNMCHHARSLHISGVTGRCFTAALKHGIRNPETETERETETPFRNSVERVTNQRLVLGIL